MIRTLLKYFANTNSDKLVQQLSDSYLMRRAAQMTASVFFRAKSIAEEAKEEKLKDLNPEKLRQFIDKFKDNLKEEIEKAKTEIENKNKRQ